MRRIRSALVAVVVLAIAVRIIWWALEPMIGWIIGALVAVVVVGSLFFRSRRW